MTKSKRWKSQLFTNIKTIALDDITADQSMQQRAKFHDEIISEYAETLRNDGQLAPVKVVRDQNGTLWLWDGFHTLEAAKQAGKATIKAEISRGTRRDAWEKSLSANETHGIRRSRADRQKAVDNALSDREIKISLLEKDAKYSFRSIAKLCNVGHQTVSRRWNDVHLPEISEEIDKAVRQEPLPGLITNQEWFAQIGRDLNVPAWLVLDRYTKSRVALTLAEEEVDEFTGATTHQTGSAEIEGVSHELLTGGPSPTHQTRSAPKEDVSNNNLTGGPSPTHQTRSAPKEDVSDNHLTGGPSPTHQTRSAPKE
ncbi:MAG: ParB N-terminal domain-containing protein, partial [Ardenticatenaceae bacterium]